MKRTKLFLDTEFTGLHKNTTLISIGIKSECGSSFYAELTDYDESQLNDWLRENVVNNLVLGDMNDNSLRIASESPYPQTNIEVKGCKKYVANGLKLWLKQFNEIEIWSDCLAYDWVLFNDLFGTAFDIPKNIHYIPFDICTLFEVCGIDSDISREEFARISSVKHNALDDAIVIEACYNKLMTRLQESIHEK